MHKKIHIQKAINLCVLIALLISSLTATGTVKALEPIAKVGLVTFTFGVYDAGWNELAYQGLLKAQTDFGITGSVYDTTSWEGFESTLVACATGGNDLCIASNWAYSGPIQIVAAAYPAVDFAILDVNVGDSPPTNLRGTQFREKESGYLAGAFAGKMTASNKVGAVGGLDTVPAVVDFLEGFENGAQCANNNVIVIEKYSETFSDPDLGAATAADMIAQGADVIFGAAGDTGIGAILSAAQADTWTIGVDTDQYLNVFGNGAVDGADMLLTSAMKRLDNVVYMTIDDFLHPGTVTWAGNMEYGLAEGGVGLAPYHETDTIIDPAIKSYIETVKTNIINGTTPVDDPCAISIWHAFPPGGNEDTVLQQRIAEAQVANPGWPRIIATYHPDVITDDGFPDVLNDFRNAVLHGWGPDLLIGENDTLASFVDEGVVLDLDPYIPAGALDPFTQFSIDDMTFNGSLYGIPSNSKAVALFYNKSKITSPPATTAELQSIINSGKTFASNAYDSGPYFMYGLWNAFGGQLMNNDRLCIADQAGFEQAMQYLKDLQTAGATLNIDYGSANEGFKSGTYDMLINGPWALQDLEPALTSNLGVVVLPSGPGGISKPMTEVNGIYINGQLPSPGFVLQILVNVGLFLTNQESSQAFTDNAYYVPVRNDVTAGPLIAPFVTAAAAGGIKPESWTLSNYWGPFGSAFSEILSNSVTPRMGIIQACGAMNEANDFPSLSGNLGLVGAKITYTGGWTQSDTSGSYRYYVVPGWTGKITPSKIGYSFSPNFRNITNPVLSDVIGLNFTPSNKPGAFNKTSPVNNATNQPSSLPLKWGASTNSTSYEYCLKLGFGSGTTCSTTWRSTGTNKYVNKSGLTSGTWYWQVRAKNANGYTYANNGNWWKFTVPPKPGAFSKISPLNNAIAQPTNLTLKWGASTNAAKYEYCIDTSAGSTCTTSWKSTNLNKLVNLTGLLKGKKYYWTVRAVNAMGTTLSNGGTWWTFTTKP